VLSTTDYYHGRGVSHLVPVCYSLLFIPTLLCTLRCEVSPRGSATGFRVKYGCLSVRIEVSSFVLAIQIVKRATLRVLPGGTQRTTGITASLRIAACSVAASPFQTAYCYECVAFAVHNLTKPII